MRFRFIAAHAGTWPVRTACGVLGVSASGYHAWRTRPDSARTVANREVLADIRRLHVSHHGRYGSPRLQMAALGSAARPSVRRSTARRSCAMASKQPAASQRRAWS